MQKSYFSKCVSIMQERKRITKPLVYAMHICSKFPREVKDLLDVTLMYHPFKNAKAPLWKNLIMTFF